MRDSGVISTLVIAGLLLISATAAASSVQKPGPPANPSPAHSQSAGDEQPSTVFEGVIASPDVREVAAWAIGSRNSRNLPFLIVDKRNAKVFLFDRTGKLLGTAPALLGLAHGDESVPGIGHRKLATITPMERTTPAGRFEASLGQDLNQDVLWIDYDTALSLHRVIVGSASEHRYQRLASKSSLDNRISYGCINVPAEFYDQLVMPAFTGTVGIVYILPETKPVRDVFPLPDQRRH